MTLLVDQNNDGKPDEYQASALKGMRYQSIFMYDDTSVVFYTYPGGVTTTNSHFPRTELREQIVSDSNYTNWKLADGGVMEGTLKIGVVSKDGTNSKYEYTRIVVMQIHGVISQEDVQTYSLPGNFAPSLLKLPGLTAMFLPFKKR